VSRPPEMWIHMRQDIREGVHLPVVVTSEGEARQLAFEGEMVWRVSGLERVKIRDLRSTSPRPQEK
jgi:hypothetical protein